MRERERTDDERWTVMDSDDLVDCPSSSHFLFVVRTLTHHTQMDTHIHTHKHLHKHKNTNIQKHNAQKHTHIRLA